jgi:hypothetical protein
MSASINILRRSRFGWCVKCLAAIIICLMSETGMAEEEQLPVPKDHKDAKDGLDEHAEDEPVSSDRGHDGIDSQTDAGHATEDEQPASLKGASAHSNETSLNDLTERLNSLERELESFRVSLEAKQQIGDAGPPAEGAGPVSEMQARLNALEAIALSLRRDLRESKAVSQEAIARSVVKPKEQGVSAEEGEDKLSEEDLKELEAAIEADAKSTEPTHDLMSGASSNAPSMQIHSGTMNPNISMVLDVAMAWFSVEEPLQTGAHDVTQSGFNLQQLEMHLDSNVDHLFRMDANLVFSQFGVEIEEAFASTLALPFGLQMRAGQFLTRFGRINSTHPHAWDFGDQPLVNGKFLGSEGNRGLGFELSWLTPLPWYAEFIVSANEANGACCARSFYGGDTTSFRDVRDAMGMLALKQFFELGDWGGVMGGLSFLTGPNASGAGNRTEIYGADLHVRLRPANSPRRWALTWQTEMMHRRRQIPYGLMVDNGFYSQLVYQHDSRWGCGARMEWVSGADDDPLDPDWGENRLRGSLQGTFQPTHFSRIRLQTQTAYGDLPWDVSTWLDESTQMSDKGTVGVMLMLEVLIGAHGAHQY